MAGIGESLLLVAFCGSCTFLTTISLSAIATNGAMKVRLFFPFDENYVNNLLSRSYLMVIPGIQVSLTYVLIQLLQRKLSVPKWASQLTWLKAQGETLTYFVSNCTY